MESVNKVFLTGTLGHDPELRHTHNGTAVTTLRLATTHRGTDGINRAEWHRVVLWGKHAEHAVETLKKGDRVAAEGRLRTSNWTDSKGAKRYRTEIDGRIVFPRGNGTCREIVVAAEPVPAPTNPDEPRTSDVRSSSWGESQGRMEIGPNTSADSPPCSECGDFTIRNGACRVCANCGATSGCS